ESAITLPASIALSEVFIVVSLFVELGRSLPASGFAAILRLAYPFRHSVLRPGQDMEIEVFTLGKQPRLRSIYFEILELILKKNRNTFFHPTRSCPMPRHSKPRELSLKWLNLFYICARKGSLQGAAEETGLTVSTVSHHLRSLEEHLGVELFNHSRRPMVLTPKGQVFLRNIESALLDIRKAEAEATAGNLSEASYLRIGAIEDFDSDIVPELAVFLSEHMPRCDFLFQNGTSAAIHEMLRNRQLDLGITASPGEKPRDLEDRLLLRDPFVVVLTVNEKLPIEEVVAGRTALPFLRFASNLMISRRIEAQLRRMNIALPHRFECSNHQTLMAMAAARAGWTITTPLLFARSRRFHGQLRMHPFPGKSFARTLSILSTPDCSNAIVELVDAQLRRRITEHAIQPLCEKAPWLENSFALIE
ncbi:LysR family transcriptional regulator, partial [Tropicimonas sp. TH_r6]|uniref:LysR family transcriptional regulator n=1 Tax=Tropicimonas sp. TH_r6 TaxID=3082085 RepID=UPI002954A965